MTEFAKEEFQIALPILRAPSKYHKRGNHFEKWNDCEFIKRFRMSKNTCSMVLDLIKPDIESITNKNKAVTIQSKSFKQSLDFMHQEVFSSM